MTKPAKPVRPMKGYCVIDPDGHPQRHTFAAVRWCSIAEHCRKYFSWPWWEARGWTCRRVVMSGVPVKQPKRRKA